MDFIVKEILKRSHFKNAEVLAGHEGLNRKITWVHIVEVETFGHLLNGQELILTTGKSWEKDEDKSLSYLQQLLDHNASALCIELSSNNHTLPNKMIALANEHHFPIIIFNQEVKFVDIIKDIHELLLGHQKSVWQDLEKMYEKLNQNLVTNGPIDQFLKVLYQGTNKQVALIYEDGQTAFFPSPPIKRQNEWLKDISDKNKDQTISFSVTLLNDKIATLYLLEREKTNSIFDQYAVKRCGEFLTQYFWKYRQQNEIDNIEGNKWILDAIHGSLSKAQVMQHIHQQNHSINVSEFIIGVIPAPDHPIANKNVKSVLTGAMMSIGNLFQTEDFYLFTTRDKKNNCYTLFLLNQAGKDSINNRLSRSIQKLKNLKMNQIVQEELEWISFGKVVMDYNQLFAGYQTALSTLNYQQNIERLEEPFYTNVTIYRLLEQFNDINELKEIIDDYIGPLLAYDQEKGTELLLTLQTYLKNLGAKNQTADDLFIVRQTLYHRLDRIKQLIGAGYENPKNRLMIEFAMYTLDYLDKSGFKTTIR